MTITTRPTMDFDHLSEHYRHNWVRMAADLHAGPQPIAWTEHHGGYWVVGSWDAVNQIGQDWETFTSFNDIEGTGNGGRGQLIPPNAYRLDLGESDPPLHTERRRLEVPFFTPKALRRWRPIARQYAIEALNEIIESGTCDLVRDVIIPTTARTTLYVTGYEGDNWEDTVAVAHRSMLPPDHTDFPMQELGRMRESFRDHLTQRRAEPNGDLISALATGTVQDRELSQDEGESMMNALVFGGFDTTTATIVSALLLLDEHPEHRERLVEDERFRKNLVEEVLRLCPPPSGMARTAVRDVELLGQRISKGESVFMWLAAANRDPGKFPSPDTFDPDRDNAGDNVAFSTGHHRCLGSPLAKAEVSDFLELVCRELPDLSIDRDSIVQQPAQGGENGYQHMRVTFRPGKPLDLEK
ncbi:cytochrome P450 [Streptomyces sp. HUAS MG91]|uniref:Cytochrome P450 n=1 Tax=Streptomyces tabacisoli TaxID=3156398 RepID=A0AAU8J4L9_9ACTN